MNKTPIEWVKNPDGSQGYTWNPITGCNNQIDGMCKGGDFPCYAYRLANGRLKERYLANKNTATQNYDEDSYPFYPRFWPERLDEPLVKAVVRGRSAVINFPKPKGIFVCDMSDLFGKGIPEEWTRKVLDVIESSPHRFYLLTKQSQNLIKFSPFPDNCWVGVTVTNRQMFIEALRGLKDVRASVRYLSIEPCLERVMSDDGWIVRHEPNKRPDDAFMLTLTGIGQVIIGAQTSPKKLPEWEWVKEIINACDKVGIPVFLKDNLKPILRQNNHNLYSFPKWAGKQFAMTGDHSLAPSNPHPDEPMRKLRQELPSG